MTSLGTHSPCLAEAEFQARPIGLQSSYSFPVLVVKSPSVTPKGPGLGEGGLAGPEGHKAA